MLIAYVDESYSQDFYFIGAAVADYDAWEALSARYTGIRSHAAGLYGTPADAEFHGHALMGGSEDWKPLRGRHREAADVYARVLRAGHDAGVRYILRGVDVRRLNARYAYPRPPHEIVLGHLLERIDRYAAATGQTEQVIVVADQIATQEEHQAQFRAYQELGTGGYRSSLLAHISAPIDFADSRHTDGLQAVDMAAYIHRRARTVTTQHPRAAAATARLARIIYADTWHRHVWLP